MIEINTEDMVVMMMIVISAQLIITVSHAHLMERCVLIYEVNNVLS